jgi:hypothetical protein
MPRRARASTAHAPAAGTTASRESRRACVYVHGLEAQVCVGLPVDTLEYAVTVYDPVLHL